MGAGGKPNKWLFHLVWRSLMYRKGRSLLLVLVLGLASALVAALAVISDAAGKQVAEEVRKYGANIVVVPNSGRVMVGTGGLSFGAVEAAAYLSEDQVRWALERRRDSLAGFVFFLKAVLPVKERDMAVQGADFEQIKRLFPWWQLAGRWPEPGEAMIGVDLARRLGIKTGDTVRIGDRERTVAALLTTGGDEDDIALVHLQDLQQQLGLEDRISEARVLAVQGEGKVAKTAASLSQELPAAQVRELRQVAATSETLLAKVELLMFLVTMVVLISCAGSVAGTMSTTVLERRKEIGLLKAMGASRLGVLIIFASEALTFSIAGGVAGFLAGIGLAAAVLATAFDGGGAWAPQFFPLSLGVSLFLALLGSLGPLLSVYRLDPVESLRGE